MKPPPRLWHESRLLMLLPRFEREKFLSSVSSPEGEEDSSPTSPSSSATKIVDTFEGVQQEIEKNFPSLSEKNQKWWEEKTGEMGESLLKAIQSGDITSAEKDIQALQASVEFYFTNIGKITREAESLGKEHALSPAELAEVQNRIEQISNEEKIPQAEREKKIEKLLSSIPAIAKLHKNFTKSLATPFSAGEESFSLFSQREQNTIKDQFYTALKGDKKSTPEDIMNALTRVVQRTDAILLDRQKKESAVQRAEEQVVAVLTKMQYAESLPHWKALEKTFSALAGEISWDENLTATLEGRAEQMRQNLHVAKIYSDFENTKKTKDWKSSIPIFQKLLQEALGDDIPEGYQEKLEEEIEEALITAEENAEAKDEVSHIRHDIDELVAHASWEESFEGHQEILLRLGSLNALDHLTEKRRREIADLQAEVQRNIQICTEHLDEEPEEKDLEEAASEDGDVRELLMMFDYWCFDTSRVHTDGIGSGKDKETIESAASAELAVMEQEAEKALQKADVNMDYDIEGDADDGTILDVDEKVEASDFTVVSEEGETPTVAITDQEHTEGAYLYEISSTNLESGNSYDTGNEVESHLDAGKSVRLTNASGMILNSNALVIDEMAAMMAKRMGNPKLFQSFKRQLRIRLDGATTRQNVKDQISKYKAGR